MSRRAPLLLSHQLKIEGLDEKTEIKIEVTPKQGTKLAYDGVLEAVVTTGSQTPEDGGSEEEKVRTIHATAEGTTLSATWDAYDEATSYRVEVYTKNKKTGHGKKMLKRALQHLTEQLRLRD